jgi:hypothetical protein
MIERRLNMGLQMIQYSVLLDRRSAVALIISREPYDTSGEYHLQLLDVLQNLDR